PGPYGLIYLGSLHHIGDYLSLLRQAAKCLEPGGSIYVLERREQSSLHRLLIKLDDHLFTFLSSPHLWFTRVLNKLGLQWGKTAKAWNLAAQAEVHATNGLNEQKIIQAATDSGLKTIFHERTFLPTTHAFWVVMRPLGFADQFRLVAQKPPRD
ncbi:MAG: hypothetical protein V1754_06405, partial [Pseudomonadota bacterium]